MDRLEQELKEALARKEPAPDFADRVHARVARKKVLVMPRWVAAAAAVIVIAGGSAEAYRYRRGMEAKRQVMEAMRVTAEKLNHIQARVNEVRK